MASNPAKQCSANTSYCPQCEARLAGPFCSQCGERATQPIPTVRELLSDFVETVTNADSRLWQTLGKLLVRPGLVPKLYLSGQRTRLLPPIRLYLIISLLFFLLLSIDATTPSVTLSEAGSVTATEVSEQNSDQSTEDPPTINCDITYQGPFTSHIKPRLIAACQQFLDDQGALIAQRFLSNVPQAMFLLMPLFAGAMCLAYWRPRRLFVEHLVFQVFNHSGIFLIASLCYVADWVLPPPAEPYVGFVLYPWVIGYSFMSLKTYYGQGKWMTLWKFTSLALVYLVLMLILMVGTALSAIW